MSNNIKKTKSLKRISDKKLKIESQKTFNILKISPAQQKTLKQYLTLIKQKDTATHQHCLRVALLGVKVAKFLNLNPKPLFYGGLLHDLGKIKVSAKLLKKKEKFTAKDMDKMMTHPLRAYSILESFQNFSAEIAVRHHRFNESPYPKKLPYSKIPYSPKTKKLINQYAKILSLIDFYDAAKNRKNLKYVDKPQRLKPNVVYKLLIKFHRNEKTLINQLYQANIFL